MKFETLNELVPHVLGKKHYVVSMQPYNAITLAMPGRHQMDTPVPGGDYVVMIDDANVGWVRHKFTHVDLFKDLEVKVQEDAEATDFLMRRYADIIANGDDPEKISVGDDEPFTKSIHSKTFLYAIQCLAVAEHRRYARFEKNFGGRYLPFRFGAGIVEGLWSATEAAEKQRRGRPGVEWLEKDHGTPILTKELMG